jgi:hypothetical protein
MKKRLAEQLPIGTIISDDVYRHYVVIGHVDYSFMNDFALDDTNLIGSVLIHRVNHIEEHGTLPGYTAHAVILTADTFNKRYKIAPGGINWPMNTCEVCGEQYDSIACEECIQ